MSERFREGEKVAHGRYPGRTYVFVGYSDQDGPWDCIVADKDGHEYPAASETLESREKADD